MPRRGSKLPAGTAPVPGEGPLFRRCQMVGYLGPGLGFTSEGALRVTFLIPPEQVDSALPLRLLTANPMPLSLEVSVFEPFEQRRQADENRLRVLGDG